MTDSTPTIDHQAHWYPKALLEALAGREGYPTLERADAGYTLLHPPAGRWRQPITSLFYDLDQQFADMSACGVDVMLASPAMIFDVGLFELPEARDLATMANEEYAATQRPSRPLPRARHAPDAGPGRGGRGTLPYVVGRLDSTAAALKSHLGAAGKGSAWKTAELPSWYLKNRFWTDSSSTTLPALKMALDVYGADRITLGSDVPYVSRERHLNFLREHLPAEQVERILTNRLPGLVD